MKISEATMLVKELEEKIETTTEEMEFIIELMQLPKYSNSQTLQERFHMLETRVKAWIEERNFYKAQLNLCDKFINIKKYEEKTV